MTPPAILVSPSGLRDYIRRPTQEFHRVFDRPQILQTSTDKKDKRKTPLSSVSICVHLWLNSDSEIKPGSEPPSIPSNHSLNSSESSLMATQSEQTLEDNLVAQLIALGYAKVHDVDKASRAITYHSRLSVLSNPGHCCS